jgi:heptosyltransferase-2
MSVVFNKQPRRILVRGTNWLGDAVMTTPALLRLREKFPAAHITLLAPEKQADLWLHHPAIDEVLSFAPGEGVFSIGKRLRSESFLIGHDAGRTALKRTMSMGQTPTEAMSQAVQQVRTKSFDLALVLPNSPRSALEVFLARIPQRIGHARPWRNFFLTQTIAPRAEAVKMRKRSVTEIRELIAADVNRRTDRALTSAATSAHQVHEYLNLAAALGANPEPLPPQLFVALAEIEAAKKKFGLSEISRPIFGLNPGAEYGPAKRWPVEKFIAAAQDIQRQTNCVWVLFGGKCDLQLCERIESEIQNSKFKIQNVCGKTSLRELMAMLKLCRVLLTNDTGPMHVAAALGTRVVVPFGSTSPELTGPGLPGDLRNHLIKSDAPCSPCFLRECPIDFRCMNGIGVDQVVEAVVESLNG